MAQIYSQTVGRVDGSSIPKNCILYRAISGSDTAGVNFRRFQVDLITVAPYDPIAGVEECWCVEEVKGLVEEVDKDGGNRLLFKGANFRLPVAASYIAEVP